MQATTHRRRWRNWLLQPLIQVRLGLYSVLTSGFFCLIAFFVLQNNLMHFQKILESLGEDGQGAMLFFSEYVFWTRITLGGLLLSYFCATFVLAVVFTHRLVGPSVAFCQHISRLEEGDYSQRVVLREKDGLKDVAYRLNALTDILDKNSKGQVP
jgi:hypothetical protein